MIRIMRAGVVVFALLAAVAAAFPQEVQLWDLDVALVRIQPEKLTLVVPIDEDGHGSVTVDEPGEYQLQLETKATTTELYVVEAEVGVDNAVAMYETTPQMMSGMQFTMAPKLHSVEFVGPDSVVIDKLAVATPGTVVRVRLVIKGPEVEITDTKSDAQ